MHFSNALLRVALWIGVGVTTSAMAQTLPVLTWVTNSSVKLEQIIGDLDWEAAARGSNLLTASQTETRFQILGNDIGYSFEDKGRLIFLFGDTISGVRTLDYDAADPLAWSTNADGEAPLVLNFFTNVPANGSEFIPIFVQPPGFPMMGDDVPSAGISLSNGVFLLCNTGSNGKLADPHASDFADIVTFDETTLPISSTGSFATNWVVSMLSSNLGPNDVQQGHFNICSFHEFGTNVLMYGAGVYRSVDVYLSMIPSASMATGDGKLYFAGLSNGLPLWSDAQSNCVPVVQDNPTNGPPWPNDSGTVGNMSVIYSTNLNLWFMTYDGGRTTNHIISAATSGIYFAYATRPWGPWSTPQLIFNKFRDGGSGVFIHDPSLGYDDGLDGPVIGTNDPVSTVGGDYAPNMIERFTRITNSTLYIYYTMSTWNPYTIVKMRSAFTITPVIDPGSVVRTKGRVSFAWRGPVNASYQVDYADALPPVWQAFTNIVTSTDGGFSFTDIEMGNGGLPPARFYRLRTSP